MGWVINSFKYACIKILNNNYLQVKQWLLHILYNHILSLIELLICEFLFINYLLCHQDIIKCHQDIIKCHQYIIKFHQYIKCHQDIINDLTLSHTNT